MSASPKKNVNSSSPQRGSPDSTDSSAQVLQVVNKSEPNETILHGFLDQDMATDSYNEIIEPPTAIARFMADRSEQNEDPMMMAQIGLVEDDWQFADAEDEETELYHSTSTSALIQPRDELEEFQEITEDEIKSSNDPAIVHDQHVRAMAYHVVPPYPIPPQYAILSKSQDATYNAQVRRHKAFTRACYPGNDEERKEAIKKANDGFPRYGSPENFVRIVHVDGKVQEVSKWQNAKCDDNCPMKKKSFLNKLAGVPGKLLSSIPYGKTS